MLLIDIWHNVVTVLIYYIIIKFIFFLVIPLEEVRKFKLYNNNFNNKQLNIINNSNNDEVSLFDCFNYETKINLMSGLNSIYRIIVKLILLAQ